MKNYMATTSVNTAKFSVQHIKTSIETRAYIEERLKVFISKILLQLLAYLLFLLQQAKKAFFQCVRTTRLNHVIIVVLFVSIIYFGHIGLAYWKKFLLVCKVKSVVAFLSYLAHWFSLFVVLIWFYMT